jgi:hypothetical protein
MGNEIGTEIESLQDNELEMGNLRADILKLFVIACESETTRSFREIEMSELTSNESEKPNSKSNPSKWSLQETLGK